MENIPIGLQLWSVREECAKNMAQTLKDVAAMGYDGVEFAGFNNHPAGEIKKMLADHGLRTAGAHIPLPQLETAWEATADYQQTLGNPYLIVPSIPPDRRQTLDDWRRIVDFFNNLVEKASARDLRIGFHNHEVDFKILDGQRPWDLFLDSTRTEVIMQLDTGNILCAGASVADYLQRYAGRAKTVHLKEYSSTNPKPLIGEGDVPWAQFFRLCETIGGTQWYIVEEERHPYPPMESARRSLEALRKMGKAGGA